VNSFRCFSTPITLCQSDNVPADELVRISQSISLHDKSRRFHRRDQAHAGRRIEATGTTYGPVPGAGSVSAALGSKVGDPGAPGEAPKPSRSPQLCTSTRSRARSSGETCLPTHPGAKPRIIAPGSRAEGRPDGAKCAPAGPAGLREMVGCG
jgi:hypothetical protein